HRLPPSLALFHLANAICAGQVLLLNDRFIIFRLLELLSVVLAVLYAATTHAAVTMSTATGTRRLPRWATYALILVVTANGGWIASSVLYRHIELLDKLPMWIARRGVGLGPQEDVAAYVAFSGSGELSSIRGIIEDQDSAVALTIRSAANPGYLRARAFELYDRSRWRNASQQEAIFGRRSQRPVANVANVFPLRAGDIPDRTHMTIRHEAQFDEAMFTPLGVATVKSLRTVLMRDDDDIVSARNLRRGSRYRLDYSRSAFRQPPTAAQRASMLTVPSQFDPRTNPRIRRLADRIFDGCETTAQKMEAVIGHFRDHYTYSLGMEIPPDQDRLAYFLLEASTGYCEYFASGTAMLLRLVGVPTRYVTGFLVTERDPETSMWTARNMDAHAWVEAWDADRNEWTIVESTVQDDRVASGVVEQLGRLGGGMSVSLGRFLQAVYDYGLLGVASWVLPSRGLLAGVLLLTLPAASVTWWFLFRRRRRSKAVGRRRSRTPHDPSLIALHKMLARMDRQLGAVGLRRHLTETLHAFARRLRVHESGDAVWARVSDWYLEYADLRYGRDISAEHLHQLQHRADRLRSTL
ncbi:MAG: transglutaminase family protein, partial [Planctomycetota bacterium]